MPGVLSRYAEGGRTHTPFTGDYYTYGQGPEHQFFTGRNAAPPVAPGGGGRTGLPAPVTAPQRQGNSGMNVLTGILGAAGAANSIGQMFGKENVVKDSLGALGRWLGITKPKLEEVVPSVTKIPENGTVNPWNQSVEEMTGVKTGLLDRIAQGGSGALGLYGGIQEGGVGGAGTALQGADKLAKSFGKDIPGLGTVGAIGSLLGDANFDDPVSALGTIGQASSLAAPLLGSGVLGAIGTVAPWATAGFAAVDMLNKGLHGKGDEIRNLQAFEQAFPEIQRMRAPGRAGMSGTFFKLPDGRVIDSNEMQQLAGNWYGATYAPDGNQQQWQTDFNDLNSRLQTSERASKLLDTLKPVNVAEGGGILGQSLGYTPSSRQKLVAGPGTGRSDDIPARLSDGEYVMDAETVALLGDGSTNAGAAKLDELRENIRRHKGRKLIKGKFSDNAKDAAAYLGDS